MENMNENKTPEDAMKENMQICIEIPANMQAGKLTPSVMKKLSMARKMLVTAGIEKSGDNAFKNTKYFELSDFLPKINTVSADLGLLNVVTFAKDGSEAYLTVYDTESDGSVVFSCPMRYVSISDKTDAREIQGVGATVTYIRRYLYMLAYEIAETDILDAIIGMDPEKQMLIRELDNAGTNFKNLFLNYKTDLESITVAQLKDALGKKAPQRLKEIEGQKKQKNKAPEAEADPFEAAVQDFENQ